MTAIFAGADHLTFSSDGAELVRGGLDQGELRRLETVLAGLAVDQAGIRLRGMPGLEPFLRSSGSIGSVAAAVLGAEGRPVRAILFDKAATKNWSLGWHQDRMIIVKERIDTDGFGRWSVKDGLAHVEPPFDLLAGMVTLRVHINPVPMTNAPLLIAPGSHKLGRIPASRVQDVVQCCGTVACLANRSDIWLYSTPILHASKAAAKPSHRRVLQVDFAAESLPGRLQWLGL